MNTSTNLHSAAKVILMTLTKCFVIVIGFLATIAYLGYYLVVLLVDLNGKAQTGHHVAAAVCLCLFFGIISFGTGKSSLAFAIEAVPALVKKLKFW